MSRNKHKIHHKGGKILGSGADGCVFSAASWPCSTPVEGYDPNDPTLVSKLVPRTDNEDETIRIAKGIIPNSKHIIGHGGVCLPAAYKDITTDALRKQFDENAEEIDKLRSNYYKGSAHEERPPSACERVKGYGKDKNDG